ncbi:helix-hairpin-helix domain-containing protein [Aequorivita sp. H23M31]|uniref:Helix-hairpin-helix domain-containing protein n=1 Tax=Aequorivita ciconiae TaxID=2494375 RepID=A0A410G6Q3_9FLAO|nr:helix-hairpin-helix domain-containing protein [Aequorivita sp. H23M31]QAA82946.1 helix-hairpin-helix domain-containing protein [Aequorivita sp. H23M31]
MELKSHFTFNRNQRSGILLLLLLIISLLCIYWFADFSEEDTLDTSSAEIVAIQKELDSLRLVELENRKPKIYPFNPNYITDFKGYTLGMSNEEIDRLLKFRKEGKWINSIADFKKVTGVSDSLLDEISPHFKFPDWVNNPKPTSNFFVRKNENGFVEKPFNQKIDLNLATAEQLQEVNGIGEALSKRIIEQREKLNGFSNDSQLYAVYGLNDEVVKRTLNLFTVKEPREILKLNVNTASASDIATIPGISFDLAKKIWEYRTLREKITDFQELEKIEGMSESKLRLIQLYLSIEKSVK